jgi:4-diphosphocytidyl-2-C-methyl-D-erythritol kinase
VSTKWVYENFALTSEANPDTLTRFIDASEGSCSKNRKISASSSEILEEYRLEIIESVKSYSTDVLHNDLEQVTQSEYPEIKILKRKLLEAGAKAVLMSGSGPTVFGVFDQEHKAKTCQKHLGLKYPDKVFLVNPIRI